MADLSPPPSRAGHDTGGTGSRGQLILIAGFALAVTLIALALVMNAAIYTENLATRSETASTSDAHAYQRATANAAVDAFRYAHEVNDGNYSELHDNVTAAMATYGDVTARQEAVSSRIVDVSVNTTHGTNVNDDDSSFEGPDGHSDWKLASDVSQTRQFSARIDGWNESENGEFRVVADGTDTWYMNVSYNATRGFEIGVNDSGSYTTCEVVSTSPSNPNIELNVSAGTVNGNRCASLTLDDVPDEYSLSFDNGSRISSGSYSVIVDTPVSYSPTASDPPTAEDVLYSMTVDVLYRTTDLSYRTDVRIAPGESND